MLARPRVPPASRLTPRGRETCAVTVAAGPEPVLSTLNPTMPVAPCDSVPTGLIRAAIWACGAGAVDGDAGVGALPGAAEDGTGAAGAGPPGGAGRAGTGRGGSPAPGGGTGARGGRGRGRQGRNRERRTPSP